MKIILLRFIRPFLKYENCNKKEWSDNMATPHNEAVKGDIAKIVLTSGDPKRC